MKTKPAILVIEDDPGTADALQEVLSADGFSVSLAPRGDEGLARLQSRSFDAVLTDLKLPGLGGIELVRRLHAAEPRVPVIVMTAHGTTETAIEATRCGAYDYLLKPFEMEELLDILRQAVAGSRLMSEPVALGRPEKTRDALVGKCRAMQHVYKEIGRVADASVSVLICGETGTGKELVARALYQHSNRATAPFVTVNCAAIPETLLESELFGHERGAFTGAESRRIGRFEQAQGGTIFLDEIGDMTPGTQAKLLRVLQEKQIQRLGSTETVPTDVRVIAATHRDLPAAMQAGEFREDLFYRLNVAVITLPPLRERKEDIADLAAYFLAKHGRDYGEQPPAIHPEAVQLLERQPWPGNVRELENVVRKALLQARGYTIGADHIREALAQSVPVITGTGTTLRQLAADLLAEAQRDEVSDAHARMLKAAERELLQQAIDLAQGNQARAARWLGLSRLTLREKLNQYGLHPGQQQSSSG